MVISSDGYFYSYSIDLENGGECTLLKQHKYAYHSYVIYLDTDCDLYSLLDSSDELNE